MKKPRFPLGWLLLAGVLLCLGLFRAEHGVAELRGRQGEPSRLFYLRPQAPGLWSIWVLGVGRTLQTEMVLTRTGRPLVELPWAAAPNQ